MTRMLRRLLTTLDGIMVAGLGLYMLALIHGGAYRLFMNPKFQLLSGATAVVLCLAGLVVALAPSSRPDTLRTIAFAVLSVLLLTSGSAQLQRSPVYALAPPAAAETVSPTLNHDGKAYTKTNPARLVFKLMAAEIPQDIVSRGIVRRSPRLDREGLFALFRVNMVCCLADAVAIGVMVKSETGSGLRDGEWVAVFGSTETLAKPLAVTDVKGVDEVPYSVLHDQAVLRAAIVTPVEKPYFPYVFELPLSGGKPPKLSGEDDDY